MGRGTHNTNGELLQRRSSRQRSGWQGLALLVAGGLLGLPLLGCGGAQGGPQERLFDSHNLLLHAGYQSLGPISTGQVSEEQPQTLRATFDRDACYVLAAFGTAGLDDIGLSITGPDESAIADERGSGRTAVVSFCTERAGEHQVAVTAESGAGEFQLTYWRGDGSSGEPAERGGNSLTLGRAVTGNLVPGERFVDYNFEVRQRRSITISLESRQFDTYLYLLRGGIEIDRDDDGGSGTNSRITVSLEPGSYVIRVGAFMNRGAGQFTLVAR